jgi:uncharacterized protein Yka (UPF0111/DUF47 family)
MFSLQQLLGKGDKFFGLLEASADEAHASSHALARVLRDPNHAASLEDFVLMRRKEKRISEEIGAELVRTFVTGLDREDIEALSHALYKIPKTVEKFAERFSTAAAQLGPVNFGPQADLVEKAAGTVATMVRHLRKMPPLEVVKELNDRLQYLEGEGDRIMLEVLRDVYAGKHDAIRAIALKDLHELLEKVIDRCRDAGIVVMHIVLKHS